MQNYIAYLADTRDDRLAVRGKRKERTAGVWRAGRIRGLLTNRTYAGTHIYGKRTTSGRPVISRPIPAIVSESMWEKAQQTLNDNFLFAPRGARNQYFLRALISCGLCGHDYVGVAANRPNGRHESYYKCNWSHTPILYAGQGRCKSKAVRGDLLEEQVWSDVEAFLRNPEPIGKTRLMGAFISYLHQAERISHFFVMSPNLTIYNKLIADFTPNTLK